MISLFYAQNAPIFNYHENKKNIHLEYLKNMNFKLFYGNLKLI